VIDSYIDAQKGEVLIEVDSRTRDHSNPSILYSKRKEPSRLAPNPSDNSKLRQLEQEVERLSALLEERNSQVNKLTTQ
jgi:hypothetical protein